MFRFRRRLGRSSLPSHARRPCRPTATAMAGPSNLNTEAVSPPPALPRLGRSTLRASVAAQALPRRAAMAAPLPPRATRAAAATPKPRVRAASAGGVPRAGRPGRGSLPRPLLKEPPQSTPPSRGAGPGGGPPDATNVKIDPEEVTTLHHIGPASSDAPVTENPGAAAEP